MTEQIAEAVEETPLTSDKGQMEIVSLHPDQIKINKDLGRYRQEMGDIKKLSDSVKKYGNILPIVITRDFELVDGGRRTEACRQAGVNVTCVFRDTINDLQMRELELEANLHGKEFTPAEMALAIRDIHRLKQQIYGETQPGQEGGHTLQDTAKIAGMSKASVINHMKIADMVDMFPQLKGAKKASHIKKAVKQLEKLTAISQGVKQQETIAANNDGKLFELHCVDSIDFMESIPNDSVDLLLTDPLYGIEHDKLMIGAGGETGGDASTRYKFDDSTEPALRVYDFLARESYRFTTHKAHGFVFLAMEHFHTISNLFRLAGWRPYIKPIIWIKRTTGQCNVPTSWPSDCYELAMYVRKDNSRLVLEGRPNWIQCDPVLPGDKIHQYEKPVPLLAELIARTAMPGQRMYDPFSGSGASIEAGVNAGLYSVGTDKSQEAYASSLKRLNALGNKPVGESKIDPSGESKE